MKIKVLEIIRGLDIGGDSGGAELFGIKLARELNELPHCEVWICAFFSVGTDTEKIWLDTLNNEGINTFFVTEWGGYNNLKKFAKGLRNLLKRIKKEKFYVAHSHFQLGSLVAAILKLLRYSKTSYRTSHIRKEWDYGKWTWILSPLFMKRIFPAYLDGEIGVSKAVCNYLKNRRPGKIDRSKIHLIYNGIDVEEILCNFNKPIGKNDPAFNKHDHYLIGCVGRLTEQKGYPYIFQAIPDILKHIPNCLVQIAGDGELKEELLSLVNCLGISDHVEFLGLRENVPLLMHQWNIFVLPSLWEGLPTVVMEAMVCELPVIATNIPGTNELVVDNETGILVTERDSKSLAQAILEVSSNSELRARLVSNARIHVNKFSINNIANQYYRLFIRNLYK